MFFKFFWDKFYRVAQASFVNVFPWTQSPLRQPWCPRYADEAGWGMWLGTPGSFLEKVHILSTWGHSLSFPLHNPYASLNLSSTFPPSLSHLSSSSCFASSSPDFLRSRLTVPPASCLFPLESTSDKPDKAYLQPKFHHFLKPLYHPGGSS